VTRANIADLRPTFTICKAWARSAGRRCRQAVVAGNSVCHWHGGRAGAPRSNGNALVPGRYSATALAAKRAAAAQAREATAVIKAALKAAEAVTRRPRGRPRRQPAKAPPKVEA
jgi:hypothetical protein